MFTDFSPDFLQFLPQFRPNPFGRSAISKGKNKRTVNKTKYDVDVFSNANFVNIIL